MQSVIDWIGTGLGAVMDVCYSICRNYGLAILLFTLVSKIILLPLSIWVHCNGLKMVRMMPEINWLRVNHYGDRDAIAEGQTRLYKKEKYSPLAGLLPIIVQLILLLGLVGVIRNLIAGGNSQELMFLGINLGWVPREKGGITLLVPVLAALSALVMTVNQNRAQALQSEQGKLNKYSMLIISVGLSLYLGFFVPAGIGLYWIASNLLSVLQMYLLNRVIPPRKHVNYEELEKSRKALAELETLDAETGRGEPGEAAKLEKESERRFFSVAGKHLVFYSESQGFYKYFEPVIQEILKGSNLTVHYITSDPKDRIFETVRENTRIQAYYFSPKKLITVFMKMDADVVVMTMSDLDNYHYKRSYVRKDIRYIYMFHYPLSTHMVLHTGALDHYDEILCVGDFQIPEIRKTEELYHLPPKLLKVCGYCQLDTLYRSSLALAGEAHGEPRILIAPSWQEGNILDSCIDGLLESVLNQGWRITVRPHPEYMKRYKPRMDAIIRRWESRGCGDLVFETDFTSNESIFGSDVVITDWSGTATEFSFVTLRPCIFVDTPPKINNPEYVQLGIEPQEFRLRNEIGIRIQPDHPEQLAESIRSLLRDASGWRERIEKIRTELIANFPDSAGVSAREILRAVMEQEYPAQNAEKGEQAS